jgi:hypothetical protein
VSDLLLYFWPNDVSFPPPRGGDHAILPALAARFRQAEARSTIAGIKEFNAGSFESSFHDLKGGAPRLVHTSLELSDSNDPDSRSICQVLLTPVEEPAGCPALCGIDHETW